MQRKVKVIEQKQCQRLIFKIHTKQLKKARWNLTLPLPLALKEYPDLVVTLASSQCLRFIDEINGQTSIDDEIHAVKRKIAFTKKRSKSPETKAMMRNLYSKLYELQFQPDYVCIVMDSYSDYDRANQGFSINGIRFRRLLGTNGGIKNSTIVYVNEQIYPELKRRLDNGRDMSKKMVPAKLEAYQALICSGSTPLPEPKGFIVVDDCITHFKDNVILINDSADGEPVLTHEQDYEVEHNNSDGYGLMTPEYSARVNEYLTGSQEPMSGMNTRYAWTKGMVYTFDFVEFAEKVAGTYEVVDAWGDKRDIRDADVILTVSMLKLWDSYRSWEDYYQNCAENHYQFATPKTTPEQLENVRNTNYQFLQSYEFTDDELQELCQPTIDEINDALGMDYRKSLVFLGGYSMNEQNIDKLDSYIRALMVEPELIHDSFIRRKIYSMIRKRIELAKKGSIKVDANYAMISGDPYALCQSMFGLEVTGLLKSGELYHRYWLDKGADELACFRAPMTCHSNIRKLKLNKSEECAYWYRYIKTAMILNTWDTTCDAMNGCDFDGDTSMVTDNPIILNNTLNSPTIMCIQRKAEKIIPTEGDIVSANKLAFNDDIGTVTNHVTSMFEVQAMYDKDSKEYKALAYRIMSGQHFQQCCIDRAKGIISKPMPPYWYSTSANRENESKEDPEKHKLNTNIIAAHKPYFMTYVYPHLRKDYLSWERNCEHDVRKKFSVDSLKDLDPSADGVGEYLKYYEKGMCVGMNPCVINRICWIFEDAFPNRIGNNIDDYDFDYDILKCHVEYSRKSFNEVARIYDAYKSELESFRQKMSSSGYDGDDLKYTKELFTEKFRGECRAICPNEKELCDIILDLCYQDENMKQFAWDIVGDAIVDNLIEQKGVISFPKRGGTEFEFGGETFDMISVEVNVEGDDDCIE